MALVDARESAIDVTRPSGEIVRHRNRRRGAHRWWHVRATLAEPFEQDVAAQGEPGEHDRRAGRLARQAADREIEVCGLAGVIEPPRLVHFSAAGTKDDGSGGPSSLVCPSKQAAGIVRVGRALEPVQEHEEWTRGSALHAMNDQHILVRRWPPFHCRGDGRTAANELSPERPEVASGDEPGRPIWWDPRHARMITFARAPFDMRGVPAELSAPLIDPLRCLGATVRAAPFGRPGVSSHCPAPTPAMT